jgi:hypothetical protein
MNEWMLISILLIAISVIIGIALVLVYRKKNKEGTFKEPDYRAFFIMGVSFLPMGIIFTTVISPAFIGFLGIGVCYMAIGLANRDKWHKKEE